MSPLLVKVHTAAALGLPNILRATVYRLGLKLGVHPVQRLAGAVPRGPFFGPCALAVPAGVAPVERWLTQGLLFGHWPMPVGEGPPQWLVNPLSGKRLAAPLRPWWRIADFDPRVGDIKSVWELSRFDWLLALAQHVREQRPGAAARLEAWLADWCRANPPYLGPNWKCGQEASIRVMHLAAAALVLGDEAKPAAALRELLCLHLQRIAPTVLYAVSQDNNHGTSEAAALYIGGHWLSRAGEPRGAAWAESGRRLIEERAARLIARDGSFSQYSVNYHRLMLDTLSLVECWRLRLALPPLSQAWYGQAQRATRWLLRLADPGNGDAPNVGANDGARLLPLCASAYRDFRPSVQLAATLFEGARALPDAGVWDEPLRWLGVPVPSRALEGSRSNDPGEEGGFAVLVQGESLALLRHPRFRFRPNQSDALHVDLWFRSENLLRDGGSYSYNEGDEWLQYFSGVRSHNTVQFDGRDQMPRLGRFLFANWLRTSMWEPISQGELGWTVQAGYADGWGGRHTRRLLMTAKPGLTVIDQVAGFSQRAVLRWRLAPGEWRLEASARRVGVRGLGGREMHLTVTSDCDIVRAEIVEGWESRHYLDKTPIPVLEVEVSGAATLQTDMGWTT